MHYFCTKFEPDASEHWYRGADFRFRASSMIVGGWGWAKITKKNSAVVCARLRSDKRAKGDG